jgi:hypothetical protein
VKGKISIIKHSDDGTTQIETPEAGAEFDIYLKSAGSYEAAKESERDHLICDENGYAQTKMLPYGIYVVHQTAGWENTEWMDDFEVNICENEKDYFYIINAGYRNPLNPSEVLGQDDMFIVELNNKVWDMRKNLPEDGNDHCIDAFKYGSYYIYYAYGGGY